MQQPQRYKQQQGYILVPAVLMLALLAMLGYLLNTDSASSLKLGQQQSDTQRVQYLAQAGLAHATWKANHSACGGYSLPGTSFGAGNYTASFVPASGSPVKILATGTLDDGASTTIESANIAVVDQSTTNTLMLQPDASGIDTYLRSGSQQNANYGVAGQLELNAGADERVLLLNFDLGALPQNAIISSASLSLNLETANSISNAVVDMHRITRSWFEGVDAGTSVTAPGATWEKYDGSGWLTYWSDAGGDYEATPVASTTIASLAPGWHAWDVTAQLQSGAASSLATDGVLLRVSAGLAEQLQFTSSDSANAAARPKLTIEYSCACGTSCASIPAPVCDADYTPSSQNNVFSTAAFGASDVEAIIYLPEGALFNGITSPSGGSWIVLDAIDERFYLINADGAAIGSMNIPIANVQGGAYLTSGVHGNQLALATSTGKIEFIDMSGNSQGSFTTSDFGVGIPAAIGFIASSSSTVYDGHLLVLDRTTEEVVVISQSGAQVGIIDANDATAATVQDVEHLPGSDKLLVTYDCCKNVIYDFSGTKLREYAVTGYGTSAIRASAIQPLTCEHVVATADTDEILFLTGVVDKPYSETWQTWAATQDASWQMQDLVDVPANAVVEVAVVNTADQIRWGGVRAVGSGLERRLNLRKAGTASSILVMHVQADGNGRIEHYAENSADVSFVLLGYYSSGTYVERWNLITADDSNSWSSHELVDQNVAAGAVAEIVLTNSLSYAAQSAGVRRIGSTVERRINLHQADYSSVTANTLLVNASSDADAIIELFAESASAVYFYVAGFWSDAPGAYTESAAATGPVNSPDSWQNFDLKAAAGVPAGAIASIGLANVSASKDNAMGLREVGSALPRSLNLRTADGYSAELATLQVLTDSNGYIQRYSGANTDLGFYIFGWWLPP